MNPMISAARALARHHHAGQVRPNRARSPKVEHLAEVAAIIAASGGTDTEIAAAWLHDGVEDTAMTLEDIRVATNDEVAMLVDGLTDPAHFATLPLAERKPLQAQRVRQKSAGVKRVKIADQTSNLRSVAHDPPTDWNAAVCMDYADGANLVVEACREDGPELAALFDAAYQACADAYLPPGLAAHPSATTRPSATPPG